MYREPDPEILADFRETRSAADAQDRARPALYPGQPRWAIGERAPAPADTDPARGDRATAGSRS